MPYFFVSSSKERSATSSLRCRVTAMPFSSMQPTTSAAPNRRASGTTFSKRSSPSSRLTELMMALPWQYVSAISMTFSSVESIISGTRTFLTTTSRKRRMSSSSSRSGLARQMSMTCAPRFTWARAISEASSNCPATMSSLNFLLPMTLVRSPTMTGRSSSVISR